MATVNLGSIKFKWKGTYSGATAYTIDDVVEYNGSSYICISNSTGNLPTNATYFEQMSSAGTNGTNGTDLGTTLTTQGDLVYRDGSGLQRLGAGTAGQVLQTGGAGANPSWSTVSSDFVLLGTAETSGSNVSSLSIDGIFTSDYNSYEWFAEIFAQSANSQMGLCYNQSGSTVTGLDYQCANLVYMRGQTSENRNHRTNNDCILLTSNDQATSSTYSGLYWGKIGDVLNTSRYKYSGGSEYCLQSSGNPQVGMWGGVYTGNTNALTGLTIVGENGETFQGSFKIYGRKA